MCELTDGTRAGLGSWVNLWYARNRARNINGVNRTWRKPLRPAGRRAAEQRDELGADQRRPGSTSWWSTSRPPRPRQQVAKRLPRRDAAPILIQRLRRLGFSIDAIREYLSLYKADATGATQYRRGLERITERIRELESKRRDLDETLAGLRALEREAKERLDRALMEESKTRRSKN